MVACEAFEFLVTFSDICVTNKRKQNNGHRILEVIKVEERGPVCPRQSVANVQIICSRILRG